MKIKQLSFAIIAASCLSVSSSYAENMYVSATLGNTEVDLGISSGTGYTVDDDDASYGLNLGYKFSDSFSAEIGYQYLGEASITATSNITGTAWGYAYTINSGSTVAGEGDGFTFGIKGNYPVTENFDIYGKAGLLAWTVDYSISGTATVAGTTYTGSGSFDDDGSDLYYGVGAQYNFNDSVGLGIEYVNSEIADADTDTFNASLMVQF